MTTNAEWMIQQGYKFDDLWVISDDSTEDDYDYLITVKSKSICKYKATTELTWCQIILKWLDMEHKEPILDEAEKKYLSAVIKPFRDKVLSIQKSSGLYASQYFDEISVYYEIFGHDLCFDLPPFEKGTMYKGMKKDHDYTLEELGL